MKFVECQSVAAYLIAVEGRWVLSAPKGRWYTKSRVC